MAPAPKVREYEPDPSYVTLSIREVLQGDRRLDGEVYLSEGFLVRRQIQSASLETPPLGKLANVWQPPRLKGIQVEPDHGLPFLAATQTFNIWPTPRKWLAPSRTPHLESRFVQPNWILVTCSGTVGNPIISYSAHAGFVISHDLLRVEAHDEGLQGYIYAFLRTRFGRGMMRATHYGNVIKHLETAHLEELPIPVLADEVGGTAKAIKEVFDARDEAYRFNMEARSLLEAELGEPDPTDLDAVFSTAATRVFAARRRLEAYHHNLQVQALSKLFESKAADVHRIGDVADAFVPARFKRVYGDSGIPYLDSEPLFKVNPGITKRLTPATKIDPQDYMVKAGWLLMACSGQIYGLNGQAILANAWHEGKVVTQHVMRIVPDPERVRAGFLETVLTHPTLGQPLVTALAHGTSVPEIAPEELLDLRIPRLSPEAEQKIADLAERASALRLKADEQEDDTVRGLETALNEVLGLGTGGRMAATPQAKGEGESKRSTS